MRLAQAFRITSAAAALAAVAVYAAPSTVEGGGLAARGVFNIDFSTVFKSLWKSLVSDAGYSNSDYCAANGNSITSSYCSNLLSKLTVTKASIKSRLTSNGVASTAAGVYAAKFMYSMLYGSDKTLALSYYNSADKSTAKWEFCFNAAATVKSDFSISGCNRAASNNKTLYLEVADVIDIAGERANPTMLPVEWIPRTCTNNSFITVEIKKGNTTLDGYPKLFPQIFNDANCFDVFYTCCRSANSLCAVTNKTTVYDVYSNIASLDIPASVSSAIANTANARRSEVGEVHDLTARDISITLSGKYIKYGVAAYNLYKDIKDIFDSLDSSWDVSRLSLEGCYLFAPHAFPFRCRFRFHFRLLIHLRLLIHCAFLSIRKSTSSMSALLATPATASASSSLPSTRSPPPRPPSTTASLASSPPPRSSSLPCPWPMTQSSPRFNP
jgi:hypothetical protein